MTNEFPFDISPIYEGERVRKEDMFVELAGPKSQGFEIVQAVKMDEIEDGKVDLFGPDLTEMREGSNYPLAMIYKRLSEKSLSSRYFLISSEKHEG